MCVQIFLFIKATRGKHKFIKNVNVNLCTSENIHRRKYLNIQKATKGCRQARRQQEALINMYKSKNMCDCVCTLYEISNKFFIHTCVHMHMYLKFKYHLYWNVKIFKQSISFKIDWSKNTLDYASKWISYILYIILLLHTLLYLVVCGNAKLWVVHSNMTEISSRTSGFQRHFDILLKILNQHCLWRFLLFKRGAD